MALGKPRADGGMKRGKKSSGRKLWKGGSRPPHPKKKHGKRKKQPLKAKHIFAEGNHSMRGYHTPARRGAKKSKKRQERREKELHFLKAPREKSDHQWGSFQGGKKKVNVPFRQEKIKRGAQKVVLVVPANHEDEVLPKKNGTKPAGKSNPGSGQVRGGKHKKTGEGKKRLSHRSRLQRGRRANILS